MPNSTKIKDGNLAAAADYSAAGGGQWRFVRISGNRTATLGVVTSGDLAYGVLENNPETNEACDITIIGIAELELGSGGATAQQRLMSDTNGRGIAATSGEVSQAIAREAGSSGERISVFVMPGAGAEIA